MDTPFAITLQLGSSLANKTGSWRTERPLYVHNAAPCGASCPAGEDPQAWLYHAEEGDYETAWRVIMDVNPLPAIMGRVCYHPCETACNRVQIDEAVGINSVERFLGDEAIRQGWSVAPLAAPSGKRVLVVGAGPSGLSAAYHLARLGHTVEIHDAGPAAGGMMRFGIPRYRLPREVLDAEIERILALGVTLHLNRRVDDLEAVMRDGAFDAAFVAVGAHLGKRAYIPAGSAARMLDAVALLRGMEGEEPPMLGRRVAVYGGGNTALRRRAHGQAPRRRGGRRRLPAHPRPDARARLRARGGTRRRRRWSSGCRRSATPTAAGWCSRRWRSTLPGSRSRPASSRSSRPTRWCSRSARRPTCRCSNAPTGVEISDGVVRVGDDLMTGCPGVFAGGDIVPAERTVTMAIGHGHAAARGIDAYLRGERFAPAPPGPPATFDALNPWYYDDAPRTVRPELEAARRQSTFDEVTGGLDAATALFEARRCLSCGSCFACDNCYRRLPRQRGHQARAGGAYAYAFDLDYCKGCGLCVQECPSGAIEMRPEPI